MIKIIEFPVLNYTVHAETTKDLSKTVKRYPVTEDFDTTGTMACAIHIDNEGFSFLFLPYKCSPGVVAHESWHVIRRMAEWVGAELDNEMIAYHLGYLTDEVWKLVK